MERHFPGHYVLAMPDPHVFRFLAFPWIRIIPSRGKNTMTDEQMILGSCCICEKRDETVRNMIALHFEAPVPGTGWGCFKCGQPSNGALTVICDDCLEEHDGNIDKAVKFVIKGYPGKKKRMPIDQAKTEKRFDHDMSQHADEVAHLN